MKMSERRAAAAARIQALAAQAAPALPAHVTYLGERNGKPHYRVMPVIEKKPSALSQLKRWLESTPTEHREGGACPHCQGTGRYFLYTKPGNNKCYRCNGKGKLDAKDMAFLNRRLGGKGPVCWVVSAAAA